MTYDRLVNYHMNRLKDKNADVRLSAIEELRKLGRIEALDALKDLFQTDPDEEVRKAAQSAGREIFVKNQETSE